MNLPEPYLQRTPASVIRITKRCDADPTACTVIQITFDSGFGGLGFPPVRKGAFDEALLLSADADAAQDLLSSAVSIFRFVSFVPPVTLGLVAEFGPKWPPRRCPRQQRSPR